MVKVEIVADEAVSIADIGVYSYGMSLGQLMNIWIEDQTSASSAINSRAKTARTSANPSMVIHDLHSSILRHLFDTSCES